MAKTIDGTRTQTKLENNKHRQHIRYVVEKLKHDTRKTRLKEGELTERQITR